MCYPVCGIVLIKDPSATDSGRTARIPLYPPVQAVLPHPPYSLPLLFLSRTEEPTKVGICFRDRRALQ